ncbi:hypothetical protein O3G_MSEX004248 [Manduca sexta]|uniref:Uncharacterized protein n=1 Tax=Manduca sexta TaxID=7130 RepID=A0A921YUW1_MANSE|nr:hypothetical protein O3G_MSEX004248 [Manduca sexta]KAG6446084.1 hypothetical protein O3G_MSEX004248 [Manduca sexta]
MKEHGSSCRGFIPHSRGLLSQSCNRNTYTCTCLHTIPRIQKASVTRISLDWLTACNQTLRI